MKRTALITGGTRGIGASISLNLKSKGYNVIANYNTDHKTAEDFSKKYQISVYAWDVSNYEESVLSIKKIEQDHGSIDIIVHNAGVTADSFLHKMTIDMWQKVIQTNLNSCFNIISPVLEGLRQRNFGRIILMSSINALKGQVGQANYCAAKAGLIGFAKALALENANKGITVNVVAPGYIETDMVRAVPENVLQKIVSQIPVGRLGQADEIARCINFLVEEEASYITGETFNINGGYYLS